MAVSTNQRVADAIELLRHELRREYGTDYSFSVYGRGYLLAASNCKDGEVLARSHERQTEIDRDRQRGSALTETLVGMLALGTLLAVIILVFALLSSVPL